MSYAIVWFRRDLRLEDNPALRAALDAGHHPIPLYIDAPHEEGEWTPGVASRTWRHRSLAALDDALRARGSGLVIRAGDSAQVLDEVIAQTGAVAVYWNRKYEPATQPRDAQIKRALRERGIEAQSCNSALLFEPWQLSTQQGGPYKMFTPFWRNALTQLHLPAAVPAPRSLPPLPAALKTDALDTLQLVPSLNWDQGFWEHGQPGEAGAHEMLEIFIDGALSGYRENRDRPDRVGTSQLSPHLHFGEIAPWRIASTLEARRT
ncbi:deoxyribodipyrimidine photolyase, partial [Xanthomonas vasicola pv. musacearum NCPPB 4384]